MNNYIVKENQDGTVTIDIKVYNELHDKAKKYDKLVWETAGLISNALKERLSKRDV